jgi:thioredoxin 1
MIELIYFHADWCGPCQPMKPIIKEIEAEMQDKLKVTRVDVDQQQEMASKYGVMSIPTFIFLKEGKEEERLIGATSKESLAQKITARVS